MLKMKNESEFRQMLKAREDSTGEWDVVFLYIDGTWDIRKAGSARPPLYIETTPVEDILYTFGETSEQSIEEYIKYANILYRTLYSVA